jgi:hypothetical protein
MPLYLLCSRVNILRPLTYGLVWLPLSAVHWLRKSRPLPPAAARCRTVA